MYCPYCGASNRDEDEVCRKCGKTILPSKESLLPSNLKIGWMMFWRCLLLFEILMVVLYFIELSLVGFVYIIQIPIIIFLFNWAGKSIAQQKYGFTISSFIGWSIYWRLLLCSLPIRFSVLVVNRYLVMSENIFLAFLVLVVLVLSLFLIIIIMGWITTQVIFSQRAKE